MCWKPKSLETAEPMLLGTTAGGAIVLHVQYTVPKPGALDSLRHSHSLREIPLGGKWPENFLRSATESNVNACGLQGCGHLAHFFSALQNLDFLQCVLECS